MNQTELMDKVEQILDDSKTGVLATVDGDGCPHMRWMTPKTLRGRPGALFAVTSPGSAKALHLESNPHVQWMIPTRSLAQIVLLRGRVNIIDNPSLKSEIVENLGKRLGMFWKINPHGQDFVVIETVIEEATLFLPMKGEKTTVKFG
jgi:general stress protein 26